MVTVIGVSIPSNHASNDKLHCAFQSMNLSNTLPSDFSRINEKNQAHSRKCLLQKGNCLKNRQEFNIRVILLLAQHAPGLVLQWGDLMNS